MAFNLKKALHSLVGFAPVAAQKGIRAEDGSTVNPGFYANKPQPQQTQLRQQILQVQPNRFNANLGVGYEELPQGNQYNPGLIPMQGSIGQGTNPQAGAYQDQEDQLNPRRQQYRMQPGQEWLQ